MSLQFNPFTGTFDVTTKGDPGDITAATSGTAASPGFAFASDPNTGIYNPGADQLALSTNGTGRLFIRNDGTVVVAKAVNSFFSVSDTDSNDRLQLAYMGTPDGTTLGHRIAGTGVDLHYYTRLGQAGSHIFSTNNAGVAAERLRITSTGLVGIGTSSPSSLLTLRSTGEPKIQIEDADLTNRIGQISQAGGAMIFRSRADTSNGQFVFRGYGGGSDTDFVTIDSSGRVGIGTTSPGADLHVVARPGSNGEVAVDSPATTSILSLLSNSAATSIIGYSQVLRFGNATATGAAGFNERARITSSGQLLVGTSSARSNFPSGTPTLQIEGLSTSASQASIICNTGNANAPTFNLAKTRNNGTTSGMTAVIAGDRLGIVQFNGADGTNFISGASIAAEVDGTPGANDMPGRLVFSTNPGSPATAPTERMRITSTGRMILTDTDTSASAATARIFKNAASTQSTPALMLDKYDNTSTTSQVFVQFTINNQGAASGQINANGASQVAFGSWSDARLKENIVDLPSQWSAIKTLRPVEFDYIESEGGGHQIGFIAQEVQEIYPDVVGERGDGMLTLSGMGKNESRLIKALQEAMERIETLEAKVAALETK